MENPKAGNVAVVDEVRSRLEASDAVIVTEYRGLKVKDLSGLRRSLKPLGAEYRIYKNTLVRIAASGSTDGFANLLTGPTGLTFVKGDAAAVTKALRDFSRGNQLLVVKGGLLGRSVLGPQETLALADLPSREVLLARLAGGLAAPLQTFAGLLQALPRNFAYGLKAVMDKRVAAGEEAGPPAAAASAEEAPEPEPVAEAPEPVAEAPEPEPAAEAPEPEPVAEEAPAEAGANAEEAPEPEPAEPNTAEPAEGGDEAAPSEGAEHAPEPDSPPHTDVATEEDVATQGDVATEDDVTTEP